MINESTFNKMIEMRLTAMADAYRMQINDNSLNELSFQERMGLLIDIEYRSRKNNRLKRLIKKASFDQPQACIADINYTADRKLDKALITRLANCGYIADKSDFVKNASVVFERNKDEAGKLKKEMEEKESRYQQIIGQQSYEIDWLKKKFGLK